MSVEVPGEQGNGNAVFRGQVAESRPVMTDGTLRYVVVVKMESSGRESESSEPEPHEG